MNRVLQLVRLQLFGTQVGSTTVDRYLKTKKMVPFIIIITVLLLFPFLG